MGLFIFIDDERSPDDVTWVKLPKPKQWDVCRSYAGFVKLMESLKQPPDFISFDHDLGLPKDGSPEKTGVDCVIALGEICCERHWKMPGIQIHTQNVVGKQNIKNKLEFYDRWVTINSSPGMKACYDSDERKK